MLFAISKYWEIEEKKNVKSKCNKYMTKMLHMLFKNQTKKNGCIPIKHIKDAITFQLGKCLSNKL